jgi:hypothetical protein
MSMHIVGLSKRLYTQLAYETAAIEMRSNVIKLTLNLQLINICQQIQDQL